MDNAKKRNLLLVVLAAAVAVGVFLVVVLTRTGPAGENDMPPYEPQVTDTYAQREPEAPAPAEPEPPAPEPEPPEPEAPEPEAPAPRVQRTDLGHLSFEVREIAAPVAGHFPDSLYRWSLRPGRTDAGLVAHSFGYSLTYVWYPAVARYFLPNTSYRVEIILEPVTQMPVPDWHERAPFADMWAAVLGADIPPSFYEIGATLEQVVGLPTEGVTATRAWIDGDNFHIEVTFAPTDAELQAPQRVFFDDFSGETNRFGLTTDFVRGPNNLFRQDMSIWTDDMSFIRDEQLVLAFALAPPELVEAQRPAWIHFATDAARERATRNTIRAGAVRTMTTNWQEMTFEHAFGYYEARIRFPALEVKQGTWGAFWLMNHMLGFEAGAAGSTGRQGAEIDIIETIDSHRFGRYNAAVHWGGYAGNHRSFSQAIDNREENWVNIFDGDFHTISLEWSPTDYRFFVNGIEFASLSSARAANLGSAAQHEVNQNPNYMKISIESALWALNAVGAGFTFPDDLYGEMVIDYVAVWNGPRQP